MSFEAALVQFTIPTSGTTIDLTDSGFGTPTAALFASTMDTNDSGSGTSEDGANGTAAVHASICLGATDGTNERVTSAFAEDNVGTTDGYNQRKSDGDVIFLMDGTGAEDVALSFNSWITDGVRLDLDNLPASAIGATCVLFKCDGAFVGDFDSSGGADDVTTSIGARVVFGFTNFAAINNSTASARFIFGNGFAAKDTGATIYNVAQCFQSTDNVGNTAVDDIHEVDLLLQNVTGSQTEGGTAVDLMDADSVRFTAVVENSVTGAVGSFLALDIGETTEVYQAEYQIPTATGNSANTSPGFTPAFVGVLASRQASGSWGTRTSASNAGTHCIGFATGSAATAQKSHHVRDDNGAATTAAHNDQTDSLIYMPDDRGRVTATNIITCDLVSFDANGYTINYTAVTGDDRQWGFLAIEDDAGGAPAVDDTNQGWWGWMHT